MIILKCIQILNIFIGLQLLSPSNEYRWTDGHPLSYSEWFVPNRYEYNQISILFVKNSVSVHSIKRTAINYPYLPSKKPTNKKQTNKRITVQVLLVVFNK